MRRLAVVAFHRRRENLEASWTDAIPNVRVRGDRLGLGLALATVGPACFVDELSRPFRNDGGPPAIRTAKVGTRVVHNLPGNGGTMAIGAVRVMAAGKAGLESLPFFVDELLAQGIPQLAPWAIDHDQDEIDRLVTRARERVRGDWSAIFNIGVSPPGSHMDADTASNRRLLQQINPLAAEATELADSPAQLGAWCRRQIRQYCRDTERLWEQYKSREGLTSSYQLAVVIPFCPEGPTSGTVGMYLGAALRLYFAEQNKADQLVVWGIELCPPVHKGESGDMDRMAVQNAFRGYVARQELLEGVPLSEGPEDEERFQCFDINVVFDGGAARSPTTSREVAWGALDRAAAQVTACLLNGAGGGDRPESTVQLKQGQRWNAYLAHVVSERSYSTACRYLRYRMSLPWQRDRNAWEGEDVRPKHRAFVDRVNSEIAPLLRDEPNATVKAQFEELAVIARELDAISLEPGIFNRISGRLRSDRGLVATRLADAFELDLGNYADARRASRDTESIIAREDLFCINIILPESQRVEAAEIARDHGIPGPITDVIGDAGITTVRHRLTDLCNSVLRRDDCASMDVNSEALFDEIMSISIGDWSRSRSNDAFRPTREVLRDYIAAERRNIPGSFSELTFDLSKFLVATRDEKREGVESSSPGETEPSQVAVDQSPAAMGWRLSDVDHDVPIEYSILVLARVRAGDGFKDVSSFGELEEVYSELTADVPRWQEHARYYGIKPPPQLNPNTVETVAQAAGAQAGDPGRDDS